MNRINCPSGFQPIYGPCFDLTTIYQDLGCLCQFPISHIVWKIAHDQICDVGHRCNATVLEDPENAILDIFRDRNGPADKGPTEESFQCHASTMDFLAWAVHISTKDK